MVEFESSHLVVLGDKHCICRRYGDRDLGNMHCERVDFIGLI